MTPEALERNPDEDVASEEPDVWAEQGYNDDPNYNSENAYVQCAAAESAAYEGKNEEGDEYDVWAEQGYNDDPNYEGKLEEAPMEDVWKEQGYENYGHGDEGYDYGVDGYDQHGHEGMGEEEQQAVAVVVAALRPLLPASTPALLQDMVSNCLQEDPAMRPTFAQLHSVLQDALEVMNKEHSSDDDL